MRGPQGGDSRAPEDGGQEVVAPDGVFLVGFMLIAALYFATIRATKVEGMVRERRAGAGIAQEATPRLNACPAVCRLSPGLLRLQAGRNSGPAERGRRERR